MIIAISGRKSSGKDTIARIIQYYTATYSYTISLEEYLNQTWLHDSPNNTWEVKKFANKLKEIVSILTGISVQDLEKEEVKQSKLPIEWTCWKLSFTTDHNSVLKMFLTEDEAFTYINGNHIVGQTVTEYLPTYREVLQTLGTELFRNQLHPNIWVNSLLSKYKHSYENNLWYKDKGIYDVSEQDELNHPPEFPKWIISDLRFENELKAIRDRDGLCVRVIRPETDKLAGNHLSEVSLDNRDDWDWIFDNSKDLNHLISQVKDFIKYYNIV